MDHRSGAFDLEGQAAVLAGPVPRTADEAITRLQTIERCIAHLEALRTESLVAAADPTPRVEEFTVVDVDAPDPTDPSSRRTILIEDAVREEIAAALRWAPTTTGSMIHTARTLQGDLPETLAALRAGEISGRHATVIADTAARLSHRNVPGDDAVAAYRAACQQLQHRLLPIARRATVANTRSAAKRALARLDAAGAAARRERARCTQDVQLVEVGDGISLLLARLTTPAAHALMSAVRRLAAGPTDLPITGVNALDGLSAGERRAHALAALVLGAVAPQVTLDVVLPASAAPHDSLSAVDTRGVTRGDTRGDTGGVSADDAGLARLLESIRRGLDHATIAGEEIHRADLEQLLADPDVVVMMRRLVADPATSTLTSLGHSTYRVPRRLREFLIRRDGTCRFPGCRRAAHRCQIDHADPWCNGGRTDSCNLGPLCTRHHLLKTHAGWVILESSADGSCVWLSPGGRRYRNRPEPVHSALENHLSHWHVSHLNAPPRAATDPPPRQAEPPPDHPPESACPF